MDSKLQFPEDFCDQSILVHVNIVAIDALHEINESLYMDLCSFFGADSIEELPLIEGVGESSEQMDALSHIKCMMLFQRYTEAVDLCEHSLVDSVSNELSPFFLEVSFFKCVGLFQTKRFPEIEQTVSSVLYHLGIDNDARPSLSSPVGFFLCLLEMLRAEAPPAQGQNSKHQMLKLVHRLLLLVSSEDQKGEEAQIANLLLSLCYMRLAQIDIDISESQTLVNALKYLSKAEKCLLLFDAPEFIEANVEMFKGRVYLALGSSAPARECFASIDGKVHPSNVFLHLGLVTFFEENFKEATSNFEKAMLASVTPSVASAALNNLAIAYLMSGDIQIAIDSIEQAIKTRPSFHSLEGTMETLKFLYRITSSDPEKVLSTVDSIEKIYTGVRPENPLGLS